MDGINITLGSAVGAGACFAYRMLLIIRYTETHGYAPWNNPKKRLNVWFFLLSLLFRVAVAGGLVWLLIETEQVNGLWGAAIIGIASDEIVMQMSAAGRKELKK